MRPIQRICLLGYGEVGRTLAEDLGKLSRLQLTAFDLLFAEKESSASKNLLACPHVVGYQQAQEAVVEAQLVISAVTAAQDLRAAQSITEALPKDCWFLDLNSVAPETKRHAAQLIEGAGGRYVEVAVMSPIHPLRSKSPMLLGGPHALTFYEMGQALGFAGMSFCDANIGKASATKMCRSVMIKGLEALISESLLSARHYGRGAGFAQQSLPDGELAAPCTLHDLTDPGTRCPPGRGDARGRLDGAGCWFGPTNEPGNGGEAGLGSQVCQGAGTGQAAPTARPDAGSASLSSREI